jgi:cyanophycinase
MKHLLPFLLFLLLCTAVLSQKAPPTIGPENGSLIIIGGGNLGDDIWMKFIELAGGAANANIILIPTAGDDSAISKGQFSEKDKLQKLGVQNITVLHTRDKKVANTEAFVEPLKKATGIWFIGGRQWKLADAYLNTLAQKEFNNVLQRGGVIAGTSAGATIQGSFMVRGDTKGNTIMVGDHTRGLDFIHNVTIDQHVLRRNRQFDLVGVIKAHPQLLGIGLDENTGIVVQKNAFEVIGHSYAAIYDIKRIRGLVKMPGGENSSGGPFYFLGKGARFNLLTRQLMR